MPDEYSGQEKKMLLAFARGAIEEKLFHKPAALPEIPDHLKEKRACFVTLTIHDKLRGCIGHILPVQELWKDVRENAVASAIGDPRFLPLSREEYGGIHVEISVLTVPEKFPYRTHHELIDYLAENKPGVILQKGYSEATFLPQVWDEITHPETFLSDLCLKAGMESDTWRNPGLTVSTYSAEIIEESGKV